MARSITLVNLRTAARQRADVIGSAFVTDPEVTEYVNQSIADLYDLLVAAQGQNYYEAQTTITTDGVNSLYALPADFYKLLAADVTVNGADRVNLRLYERFDRPYLVSSTPGFSGQPFYYRLRGGNIELLPLAASNVKVTVYYIPAPTRLVNDSDTFDGIAGWEEYVTVDVARKCATKEESWELVQALQADLERLKQRITDMAPARDQFSPPRVIQTRGGWNPRTRRPLRF